MNLLCHRFHTQHLAGNPLQQPEEVVRSLTAVQSQDHAGAKWSVGQRLRGATDATIQQAFDDGRFLRTHVLRPTWHYVAPDDIRWMLALTAPRIHGLMGYMNRQLELDGPLLARCTRILEKGLADGAHRTRAELGALLKRGRISAVGQRLGHITMYAELEAVICSGAMRGKQHTYALLPLRAPAARVLAPDAALAELVRRFLTSHAPATLDHFVWWSGLSMKEAREGLASVNGELVRETIDDKEFWYGPDGPPSSTLKGAWLIPEYDEVLTRYEDLNAPDLDAMAASRTWEDRFLRPVIIDGRRAGTWRRDFVKGGVEVELNLFAKLSAAQTKALRAAVARYCAYLELVQV